MIHSAPLRAGFAQRRDRPSAAPTPRTTTTTRTRPVVRTRMRKAFDCEAAEANVCKGIFPLCVTRTPIAAAREPQSFREPAATRSSERSSAYLLQRQTSTSGRGFMPHKRVTIALSQRDRECPGSARPDPSSPSCQRARSSYPHFVSRWAWEDRMLKAFDQPPACESPSSTSWIRVCEYVASPPFPAFQLSNCLLPRRHRYSNA